MDKIKNKTSHIIENKSFCNEIIIKINAKIKSYIIFHNK